MRLPLLLKCAAVFTVLAASVPAASSTQQTGASESAPQTTAKSSLLVLNKVENTLAIIDPTTLQVLGRVPVGVGPHEVITSADGRLAYVANYGTQQVLGNSISIIDLAARKELKRVELGPLFRPHGIVEVGGKIYFTAEVNRAVARYDPASDRVDWVMGTGQTATHMLAVTPDGKRAYTANIASDTVTAIELNQPPGPKQIAHIAVGKNPEAIDVSPDGRELWVGQNGDGSISIIDTATNKVKETVKVGEVPIRVKFTPDGRRVLVSDAKANQLIVLDAATRKEVKRMAADGVPVGILITPDGRRAFVAAMQANKVLVVDLEKLEVTGSIAPGDGPDGMAWAKG
ncbi:MAG TPA: cytochrome D1 domain-containing protein [Pyrinomonadaceae bacterium]|nr:cytochrome D1 domain-containing protein [Pyrinomonadaceae bacterium]